MAPDQVLYEASERVATITLNRPEAMNAFAGTMREDLLARLEAAAGSPDVRCVVLTGTGRAFCAGGDVASMAELQARDDTSVVEDRMAVGARIVTLVRAMPKPVVACVNGAAAGAGLNLALACDLRYAARSATFAASFVRLGLVPDWGGHHLLARLAGTARATELLMTGERIDADEALRLGLVNRVHDDEVLTSCVRERVLALARGPAAALAAIKRGVHLGATDTLEETLAFEAETQRRLFLSDDAREGMQAFLAKRPARFGAEATGAAS